MVWAKSNQVCQFVFSAFADGCDVMNVNERIPTAYHALALEMSLVNVFGVLSISIVLIVRILCAGNVLIAWRVNSIPRTEYALPRAVFSFVNLIRLDVERFAASLAYNRNAPVLFLLFGFLEKFRPRLIGAIAAAKMAWRLDVLIALFHKRLAAMFAFDFNILRCRVAFWMVNTVLLVALHRAESIAAFISVSTINLAARFAGNHGQFDASMLFRICQSAFVGAIEFLASGKRLVTFLAVHCVYPYCKYRLITNYTAI